MGSCLNDLTHVRAELFALWKMQHWLFYRACKKMVLWVLIQFVEIVSIV